MSRLKAAVTRPDAIDRIGETIDQRGELALSFAVAEANHVLRIRPASRP